VARRAVVQGVDESTHFAPHVRGEIGGFAWHIIEHLPSTWEEGKQARCCLPGRLLAGWLVAQGAGWLTSRLRAGPLLC
jgi:hypothetical protein